MKKLSTGQDSTLKNWRTLAIIFFGVNSKAVQYIDDKITINPHGDAEEVLCDEEQFIQALIHINNR